MKLENSSLAFCLSFNSLKALGNYQNLNKTREQRDESSFIKKMPGGGGGGGGGGGYLGHFLVGM